MLHCGIIVQRVAFQHYKSVFPLIGTLDFYILLIHFLPASLSVTEHNWVTLLHGENNLSLTVTFDHNLQSTL